jgi:two-component system chemotaxis response regulator CheY
LGKGRCRRREEEYMAVNMDMSILIVDDYKTMLRLIRNLLGQIGFKNVDEATDAHTALSMLKSKSYDLIISDWNMQPMTGLELLHKVRSDDKLKSLPFIMATAESTMDNVAVAKQAGVSNYIVKPFSAAVLKVKLAAVLGEF